MMSYLYEWQTLVGSMIGASVPILFWILQRRYEKFNDLKNDLLFLERTLVGSINNIVDAKRVIKSFLDNKVGSLIQSVEANSQSYSAESAFFPIFFIFRFENNIFSLNLKSGYLENKINRVAALSHDIALSIEDIRRQFEHLIEWNIKIAMQMADSKINPPSIQNNFFKKNLQEFKAVTEKEILKLNANIYLVQLIESRTTVQALLKDVNRYWIFGFFVWRLRFSCDCRYFKNRRALEDFKQNSISRIEDYVKKQIPSNGVIGILYRESISEIPRDLL